MDDSHSNSPSGTKAQDQPSEAYGTAKAVPFQNHALGGTAEAVPFQNKTAVDAGLKASSTRTQVGVARVQTELFGSLALTGHGHATDRAVLLGLSGEAPETIDPATIYEKVGDDPPAAELQLLDMVPIPFNEDTDLLFLKTQTLPGHSNGMRYTAFDGAATEVVLGHLLFGGRRLCSAREGEDAGKSELKAPPFPFSSADQLLQIGERDKTDDLADHAGE